MFNKILNTPPKNVGCSKMFLCTVSCKTGVRQCNVYWSHLSLIFIIILILWIRYQPIILLKSQKKKKKDRRYLNVFLIFDNMIENLFCY